MPDWFASSSSNVFDIPPQVMLVRLMLSAIGGAIVTGLYVWKRGLDGPAPSFPLTLALLAVLIAMVTQVVGDHIARAFSLVGALSIVRFRTVVDDTQDIAFVIFSVVVGMAIGAGNYELAFLGTAVASSLIVLSKWLTSRNGHGKDKSHVQLFFRTAADSQLLRKVEGVLDSHQISHRILGADSARGGTMFEWSMELTACASTDFPAVLTPISRIEGVSSLCWKFR